MEGCSQKYDEEETHAQSQVEQVSDKLQVKRPDSLLFPLPVHKHVTDMECILHNGRKSCCGQYHVSERL